MQKIEIEIPDFIKKKIDDLKLEMNLEEACSYIITSYIMYMKTPWDYVRTPWDKK